MAKRKSIIGKNIPVPHLIIPRTEAESKIYGRITLGKKILGLSISNEKELAAAKAQRTKWNDDNEVLLKGLFDSDAVFKDYSRSSLSDAHLTNASWRQRIADFYESISNRITTLELIIERLELIPEKVVISQTQKRHEPEITDTVSTDHDQDDEADESVIERLELIPEAVIVSEPREIPEPVTSNTVFIIHGHDEKTKGSVAEFIEKLGLKVVILSEQPNAGKPIIEQFESGTAIADYAVAILTPEDIEASDDPDDAKPKPRAGQNLLFELGYFCGVLGRSKVSVLIKEGLEIPVDYFGVACTLLDRKGAWQFALAKDMKSAGLSFDANRIFY